MGKLTRFILPAMTLATALTATSCGQYRGVGIFRDLKTAIPTIGVTALLSIAAMTVSDRLGARDDDKNNDDDWTRQ